MLKKNDVVELTISGMTNEGSGVGKINNMVVFVSNSAVGDVLSIVIIKITKNYAVGKILEIIISSDFRQEQNCEVFSKCGGCVYRHIKYKEELRIKQQNVNDSISRIGGIKEYKCCDIVGTEKTDGYRNKAQLPIDVDKNGRIEVGFYAYKSHRVIPIHNCKLQPYIFGEIIETFKKWAGICKPIPYDEVLHRGKLRHLYIRYAENTGEIMVCLVVNGNGIKGEEIFAKMLEEKIKGFKSLIINTNTNKSNVILGVKNRTLFGSNYIVDIMCGLKFKISPLSFYQVNLKQAELLYNKVSDYTKLSKNDTVLDLYCGTGTIGLTLASKCKKVIGVEIVQDAIEDAKDNAILNGIVNTKFICGDSSEFLNILNNDREKIDVIILDPPRKGCSKETLNMIGKIFPQKIVYVSCDSSTLARDVKILNEEYNYILEEVTPFDLFPRTKHVECVALMSRV